jgi:hypothetical protein
MSAQNGILPVTSGKSMTGMGISKYEQSLRFFTVYQFDYTDHNLNFPGEFLEYGSFPSIGVTDKGPQSREMKRFTSDRPHGKITIS